MPEAYLSPEWLELFARAIATAPVNTGEVVRVGQIVNTASGEVAYTVRVGGGSPASLEQGVATADVTLVEDYEAAVDIASGRPAGELMAEGRVKLRGDARVLVDSLDALSALADALATLSADTTY